MVAHQTKSFKGNHRSLLLISLGVIGMGMFLAFYVSGMFSFAAPESDSSISSSDKVTVDGVVNVAQYLTSLVLESPKSKDTLVLSYDSGHNALRIDGNINADALTVGAENQSSQGSTVIGGTRNEVFSSQNGLIVGGDDNKIKNSASNAVVVGSKGTNILSDNSNILSVGTEGAQFREGNQVLAAIGGEVDSDNAKNSVALGQGRKKISGPTSVLLGGNIDSGKAHHLFVWSDSENAFQPQNSNGFYVKSQNGFGLNTTKPTTQLDIGNAGALRVPLAYVRSCNTTFKGVVSYAPLKQHNQYKSFCGCNGEKWVPLAGDLSPETVAACAQRNRMKCTGTVENANKGKNFALPLWNPDANGGKGDWEALGWKYSSNPSLSACQFNCKVGYHPNANNPEGWLPSGACLPCSDIANKSKWKSAGTGLNNCDFSCKGGFYYTNTSKLRACSSCKIGTYTTNDNQDVKCKPCKNKPKNAEYSGYGTGKDCPWECNAGYVKYGNRCYKKTKEMSCRTLPQDIINNPGNYRKGPEKYSQIFNAATGKYEPETKSRAYRQGNVRTAAHQGDFTVTNKNICVAPILQPCEWDCNCGYSYDENTHTCIKPECATVFKPGIYHYPLLDKFYDYGYPVFPDKTGWGRADKVDTASIPLNEKYPLTKWQRKDGMFKWTSTDIWPSALCERGTVENIEELRKSKKNHGDTLKYTCEEGGNRVDCSLSLKDSHAHFESWGGGPASGDIRFYPVCNDGYSHSNKAGKCVIAKFGCNTKLSEKMKKDFVKPTNNDFCSGNGKLNLKSLEGIEFVTPFEFLQYMGAAKEFATASSSSQHMKEAVKESGTATSSSRNSEAAGSRIADLEANVEKYKLNLPKKLVYHCQYDESSYDDLYEKCEIKCEKGVVGDNKRGYTCRQKNESLNINDKYPNYGKKPCPDGSGKRCYYNKGTEQWVDSYGNPTADGQPGAVVGESFVGFVMVHDPADDLNNGVRLPGGSGF